MNYSYLHNYTINVVIFSAFLSCEVHTACRLYTYMIFFGGSIQLDCDRFLSFSFSLSPCIHLNAHYISRSNHFIPSKAVKAHVNKLLPKSQNENESLYAVYIHHVSDKFYVGTLYESHNIDLNGCFPDVFSCVSLMHTLLTIFPSKS